MARIYIGDRYRLKEYLRKQGAMSLTLKCIDDDDEDDSKVVVVKLLEKPDSSDEDLSKQIFQREVESLKLVSNHPNVVKILDSGFDDSWNDGKGAYYIVLGFIKGSNLKEKNEDHSIELWSIQERLEILRQLLEGMNYIHNVGVIHRDVKPANVMIREEDDQVKIIDFGISKVENEFYNDYTIRGYTPAYCSPEQQQGQTVTRLSDIYSLGIVFYEILSAKRVKQGEKLDLNEFPAELRNLVLKMTAVDPAERYQSIMDVKAEFSKILLSQKPQRYLLIDLSPTVIKTMTNLGVVQSQDVRAIKQFLQNEFNKDCKIASNFVVEDGNRHTDGTYWLYGRQYTGHVSINNRDPRHLFMFTIRQTDPAILAKKKEEAISLDEDIQVIINGGPYFANQNIVNIEMLFASVDECEVDKASGRDQNKSEYAIIDKWKKILELNRKKLDEEKSAVHYDSFDYNEADGSLILCISAGDQDVDIQENFGRDTMLQISKKGNINRSIDVGYMRSCSQGKLIIDIVDIDVDAIADSGTVAISKRMEESSLSKQEKAMKSVKYREIVNPDIAECLFNPQEAKSKRNVVLYQSDFCSPLIDEPKKRSLQKALSAESLFLLQGPPGTGKTTFITELVYQIIHGNSKYPGNPAAKILIASQSHVAVDNALSGIRKLIPNLRMIRVGRDEKIADSSKDFTLDAYCNNWAADVRAKCDAALQEFKKTAGLDDSLKEQHQLIQTVEEIRRICDDLRGKLSSVKSQLKKTELIKEKWGQVNSVIANLQDMLAQKETEASEDFVLSIMGRFFSDLSSLSDGLRSTIDESIDISAERAKLQGQQNMLTQSIAAQEQEEQRALIELGVTSEEEFATRKAEVITTLAQREKQYTLYAKIEKLVEEWKEQIGRGQGLLEESLMDAALVGSTCLGLSRLERVDFRFDWVIIDEAGKATPSEVIVPMCLGKKVVLVGDHKQLPPVVDQELLKYQDGDNAYTKDDLETSLFEYLVNSLNDDCQDILSDQYRMHPAIGRLISQVFYDNELISKSKIEDKTIPLSLYDGKPLVWLTTSRSPRRKEEELNRSETTYRNPFEVEIIFKELLKIDKEIGEKGLLKTNSDNGEKEKISVAIIAGYSAQKDIIIRKYETEYKNVLRNISVEINTVDAFQGRETDIVFYSVVRSNPFGKIGFLKDARRLNVAFSRSRKLLIIVGDHECANRITNFGRIPNPFPKVISHFERNKDVCLIREVKA